MAHCRLFMCVCVCVCVSTHEPLSVCILLSVHEDFPGQCSDPTELRFCQQRGGDVTELAAIINEGTVQSSKKCLFAEEGAEEYARSFGCRAVLSVDIFNRCLMSYMAMKMNESNDGEQMQGPCYTDHGCLRSLQDTQ